MSQKAYLVKYSKEQNIEFNPGFDLDQLPQDKTKDNFIDNIISLSCNILIELFTQDVYKLDLKLNKISNKIKL